jgi:hypothetical protein
MTCHLNSVALADEQKGQVCGILSVGCDRETAANFVGCTVAEIGRTMKQDPAFAANVRRTEAATELAHMRNVQQAAKDPKNWRASVWWLERHSPERFGRRGAGQVTVRQLETFMETITGILSNEIPNDDDRQRVIAGFDRAIGTLRQMVQYASAEPAAEIESPVAHTHGPAGYGSDNLLEDSDFI